MTVPKTTVTLHLKGQTWTLQVAVHSETLDLELKEQTQGTKYDAHLSSSYLEQLTKKTGNYKRFSVFVEMLLSALESPDGPVSIDLLTPQDIMSLRKENQANRQQEANLDLDKIYLVMTYAVAFDRVHYPIPLAKVKEMSGDQLKTLKSTLSRQMAKMTQVLKENADLKKDLEKLSRQPKLDKSFTQLQRVQREMESELRLIERHGTNPVVQSCTYRLRQLLSRFSEALHGEAPHQNGLVSRNRSTSHGRSPARKQSLGRSQSSNDWQQQQQKAASRRSSQSRDGGLGVRQSTPPAERKKYKVIRSQPLVDAPSRLPYSASKGGRSVPRNQSKESLQGAGYRQTTGSQSRQRSNSASSAGSNGSRRSFSRFDPTEYVRTRERSMEERRRKSLPRNERDSSSMARTHQRPFGSGASPNTRNPPRRPLYETTALRSYPNQSQQNNRQYTQYQKPKSDDLDPLHFDVGNDESIDTRLQEIHRILQSAIL